MSDKPSKNELLGELESIRDFLVDPDIADDDIPTLTVVAGDEMNDSKDSDEHNEPNFTEEGATPQPATGATAEMSHTVFDEDELNTPAEKATEQTEDSLLNTVEDALLNTVEDSLEDIVSDEDLFGTPQAPKADVAIEDMDYASELSEEDIELEDPQDDHYESAVAPHIESSESDTASELENSAFDLDSALLRAHNNSPADFSASDTSAQGSLLLKETADAPTYSDMPKAAGENPFLPPHIRERLGKHKDIIRQYREATEQSKREAEERQRRQEQGQRREIQGDLLAGFGESTDADKPHSATSLSAEKLDALVDEVIEDMLPELRRRLRDKLKRQL